MINKHYVILGLISLIYMTSCSEICEGECIEEQTIPLRILSSIDSTDIVFGENKIYDFNDLVVFGLSGVDTTIIILDSINLGNPEIESYIIFDNNNFSISRLFIDYGDSDVDTLDFNFMSADCCHEHRYLDSASQNNIPVYSHNGGSTFVTLLK